MSTPYERIDAVRQVARWMMGIDDINEASDGEVVRAFNDTETFNRIGLLPQRYGCGSHSCLRARVKKEGWRCGPCTMEVAHSDPGAYGTAVPFKHISQVTEVQA